MVGSIHCDCAPGKAYVFETVTFTEKRQIYLFSSIIFVLTPSEKLCGGDLIGDSHAVDFLSRKLLF